MVKLPRRYGGTALAEIGFEQSSLVSQGGQALYAIEITVADEKSFMAKATSVVDFDNDGQFNVWTVDQTGAIKETVPD